MALPFPCRWTELWGYNADDTIPRYGYLLSAVKSLVLNLIIECTLHKHSIVMNYKKELRVNNYD